MPKHIEYIISAIVLSPSSHNTQPWTVSVQKNNIYFFAQEKRKLTYADPTNREFYISMGCCIGNAVIAAKSLGFECSVEYFPNEKDDLYVAKLTVEEADNKNFLQEQTLSKYFEKRLSNRGKYKKNKSIPSLFFKQALSEASEWNVFFDLISEIEKKEKLALITQQAIKKAISNPSFRVELMDWVRHNWTKKTDGMPGYAIGLPSIPSILFPALIHSPQMPEEISKGEYDMVMHSSAIGIISITKDDPTIWVKTGVALQYIWLTATKMGLSLSLLSGAVEMEDQRIQVAKVIEKDYLPSVFFRVGYALKASKASPRRTIDDILVPFDSISKRIVL